MHAPILIQSIREAYEKQSCDNSQPFGSREVVALSQPALVAQTSVPDCYARSWVVSLAPVTEPGQQGAQQIGSNPTPSGWVPYKSIDAFAVVEWGIGGSAQWALVDWFSGQQFAVYGSFVRLYAMLRAYTVTPPNVAGRFAAHITPGECPRPAYRTVRYGDLNAAATTTLAVPPLAKRVWVMFEQGWISTRYTGLIMNGHASDLLPRTWSMSGLAVNNTYGFAPGLGVVLPVSTNFIGLFNNNAQDIDLVLALYELAL